MTRYSPELGREKGCEIHEGKAERRGVPRCSQGLNQGPVRGKKPSHIEGLEKMKSALKDKGFSLSRRKEENVGRRSYEKKEGGDLNSIFLTSQQEGIF